MKKIIAFLLVAALAFGVFASCGKQDDASEGLKAARDYIEEMYSKAPEATASDYKVIASVVIDSVPYVVEWSVDVSAGVAIGDKADNQVTIDVDEKSPDDVAYKLTATIKDPEGKTETISFSHKVPAFRELSWQEFVDAQKGDTVVVRGVVTGLMAKSKGNSYNCIYMQDKDGGYYVYGMATDPVADDKIEVGMEIRVTGTRDTYSGTYEIAQGTGVAEIINSEKVAVTPADYTELFTNAKDLKDASLVEKQALLVTVKGVEILKQTEDDAKSGYYRFKLGDKSSYIRISSSVCPLTKDEQTAFKTEFENHVGWIAEATGVLCVYDGAFYLTPVTADAFKYVSLPEKSDAEMVAYEKENTSLAANVTENSELFLPVTGGTYSKVAITWTSDNACAVVDNGKLKVTLPETETVVKVTAEFKSGDAVDTRVFEITVDAASTAIYEATVVELPEAGKPYKFALDQAKVGKTLYFTGEMDGNYLAVSDKAEKAVDILLEAAEGGYRAYFEKDGKKIYVDVYEYTAGKVGVQLTETPTCVYTWNAELSIPVTVVAGATYYIGTYNQNTRMSASNISYISGDSAALIGVSQFPSHLVTVREVVMKPQVVTAPEAGSSYKFFLEQASVGQTLYFTGAMDGNYLAVSDKYTKAVDVIIEAVEGGYRAYFEQEGKKIYIDVYEYTAGKVGVQLTETPTCVYTWNAELSIPVTVVAGATYYIGTYNQNTRMSASNISYISGDNAPKIGVSQFPSHLGVMVAE
ncbi:MAG: hypothetical protein ILO42_08025 [Clostridia bacterium]|nr:hypothetical protein [Clostridia bacterium]